MSATKFNQTTFSPVSAIGTINSTAKSSDGASIVNGEIVLQSADQTNGGLLGLSYQTVGAVLTCQNSNAGSVKGLGMYNPDTTDNNGITFNVETDTTGAGAQTGFAVSFFGVNVTTHDHATVTGTASWSVYVNGAQKTIWGTDSSLNIYTDFQQSFNNGINVSKDTTVTSSQGFLQGNGMGGSITIPAGAPITGTSVAGTNLAQGVLWSEDIDDGIFPTLGTNVVGYVGQIAGLVSGKTMSTLNMAVAGASDGGSIAGAILDKYNMYAALGLVGGTLATINTMRGFYVSSIFGGGTATEEYGISVESATSDNYFRKSITIGQTTESKTTETNTAIEVGDNKDIVVADASAFYMGPVNTDGTWRFVRSGTDLVFERRETGVYVQKGIFTA